MTNEQHILILTVIYSSLAIIGLLGNVWVLLMVSSQLWGCGPPARPNKPALQSSAYIYLILLSVVDLISLMPVPMLVTDMHTAEFVFGDVLCRFIYICEGVNKTLSPLVLTALSIDRYIAICRPNLIWMRQTKFALSLIATFVVASMCFIIPIALMSGEQEMLDGKGRIVTKCAMFGDALLDFLQTITCYFAPLGIIVFVYMAIMSKLFRHTRYSSVGRKTSISLSRVIKCSVMVVAFYFICWTPYWCLRMYSIVMDLTSSSLPPPSVASEMENHTTLATDYPLLEDDNSTSGTDMPDQGGSNVFWMYILHAFPYIQSAFNWLFYAFLNRNLRNSSNRCGNAVRSAPVTSTVIENGNSASQIRSPLWRNIQHMGNTLKTAGMEGGQAIMKLSPFRSRSVLQSRSSICMDSAYKECLVPNGPLITTGSMIEIKEKKPAHSTEPATTVSLNDSVHLNLLEPREISKLSDSSSVEWL